MTARGYEFYLRVLKLSLKIERSERVRCFQHDKIKFASPSVKAFAGQSESCIVYIQIAHSNSFYSFSDLAAFLPARPSNFPAKAEQSSRLCQLVAAQTCLYGIKKTRTHRAHNREMSHCSKKI